ncbi:uncharacterized protein LOC134241471 [Saccostrea cucullata]|uniref:uncharacterized protein LOC134241471 n=1 Tax=Saccostrea cuccullata TaxID=36930 RepID=UPI002ED62543
MDYKKKDPKIPVMDPYTQAQKLKVCDLCKTELGKSKEMNFVAILGPISPTKLALEACGYSSPPDNQLLYNPEIITKINTKLQYKFNLYNVACLNDDEILSSGMEKTRNLYNKWRPFNICSTSSGDLLVVMQISDDFQQSNIVGCYSGTTKKQTICILFYDRGHGFHSSDNTTKCFTENKNLDICVADSGSNEVLVVNQAGTLRFRYLPTPKNQPFYPAGITTDS